MLISAQANDSKAGSTAELVVLVHPKAKVASIQHADQRISSAKKSKAKCTKRLAQKELVGSSTTA